MQEFPVNQLTSIDICLPILAAQQNIPCLFVTEDFDGEATQKLTLISSLDFVATSVASWIDSNMTEFGEGQTLLKDQTLIFSFSSNYGSHHHTVTFLFSGTNLHLSELITLLRANAVIKPYFSL